MLFKFGYLVASSAFLTQVIGSSDGTVERNVVSPRDVSEIKHRLHRIARSDTREFERNTTLDTSFDGAVLFK